MTPNIKEVETLDEYEIKVVVLVEFRRNSEGKIIGMRDIAFPTEDEMLEKVAEQVGDHETAEEFDITSSLEDCPRFVVDPDTEPWLSGWNPNWRETLVGDWLCEVCKFAYECHPEWAEKLKQRKEGKDVKEEKKKEPRKQKPFRIALD